MCRMPARPRARIADSEGGMSKRSAWACSPSSHIVARKPRAGTRPTVWDSPSTTPGPFSRDPAGSAVARHAQSWRAGGWHGPAQPGRKSTSSLHAPRAADVDNTPATPNP